MTHATMTSQWTAPSGLEMRWLPVTDERGHTRLEAVWIDVAVATTSSAA